MSVYVVVCVFIILAVRQRCVGVCMSVYVCVGVLIWCRLGTNEEACFVIASVTLTASLSTQELLSHADCFYQSRAEASTPQRFTALWVWAALCLPSLPTCAYIFPAEQTAPCWQLRNKTLQ